MSSKYGSYSCYHCLCEVCTKVYCRMINRRYRVGFCTSMIMRERCPMVKCDFFQHREKAKVFRVKRKQPKRDVIMEKLEDIQKGIDKLGEKL